MGVYTKYGENAEKGLHVYELDAYMHAEDSKFNAQASMQAFLIHTEISATQSKVRK